MSVDTLFTQNNSMIKSITKQELIDEVNKILNI